MKKKLLSMLLAIALLSNNAIAFAKEQKVNDNAIESNIEEERLMSDEIEGITKLDISTELYQEESSVDIQNVNGLEEKFVKGEQFILEVNSKNYTVNGKVYKFESAPISIKGRTYVSLRFITEKILDTQLNWNQSTQTIVISKDDVTVQMTVGNKTAIVNSNKVDLDVAPIIKDATTYVPLNILSEYFGMSIAYNGLTRKITVTGKDQGINHKPISDFIFSQSNYIAGQKVFATDTSYDPDGHKVVEKEWCVKNGGTLISGKTLSSILKQPSAGSYIIGLRAKDQYDLWGDWTYKELVILPNEAPIITYFATDHMSYAQGEPIKYRFEYENENWENITNEKWTYRRADEAAAKSILGKPNMLFAEGDYIIGLQIDDEYGNRSEVYEITVHITDQVLKKELSYRFTQGKIGEIIDNYQGFNYRDYEDAEILHRSTVSGTMIMSDSPEEVSKEGVLYRDTINGVGRILVHHINRFSNTSVIGGNKRLVIVAENVSSKPVNLTLSNKTIRGPVTDVLYLGQRLLYDYLVGSSEEVMVLQPGEKRYIYDSEGKWTKESCISALMDVLTTGEVTFTMAAVSVGSTINNIDGMELLPPITHPRGTFKDIAINYTLNLDATKPTKLLIGTGQEEWIKGYDALTKLSAQNKGNYGVSYYITITAKQDTGIILNPRANVFRGAIEWKGAGVYNIPAAGAIFDNKDKAISLGMIKAGETKTFEYMLPNGSSAPVLIGFIPRSYWDD